MDQETESQIKELQMLEQNLQAVLMQKQAFQMELSEIESALEELSNTKEKEIYKIAGNIMIKSPKDDSIKDLKQKKDMISLRLKTITSQEKTFEENAEGIRKKVLSKIKK